MKKILRLLPVILAMAAILAVFNSCSMEGPNDGGGGGGSESGTGGSMARFTIYGDYIYTVDQSALKLTRITNPAKPEYLYSIPLTGFNTGDIETIFVAEKRLFIGSRSAMYIYDVSDPLNPRKLSETSHFRSCDPVVAYGDRAYVTLNNARVNCGNNGDFLFVFDIHNVIDPDPELPYYSRVPNRIFEKNYNGIHPAGLGVDGKAGRLFVCTNLGVEVWEITDIPEAPIVYISHITYVEGVGVMDAYDVIPLDGLLIVVGKDGLFQFDYTGDVVEFLSSYTVKRS